MKEDSPAMTNKLAERLKESKVLLADGATGTNLFGMGLETGDSPELWNTDHPDRITELHQSFVDAGSDIILTNSFGGTHYRLALHNAGHRVEELNKNAAQIAKAVASKASRDVLVAGSIGPTGEILAPNGPVSIEDAAAAFHEQALALKAGGADIMWIETISSTEEIQAAVRGVAGVGLPVVFTVSIDTNGRTMMGLTAADTITICADLGTEITAVGTNCGIGASEVVAAIKNLTTAKDASKVQPALVAKANCGIPEYIDGEIVYNGTPELMALYATMAANAGATIIGGCCGTSPTHVKAMRDAIDQWTPAPTPTLDEITNELGEVTQGARAQLDGDLTIAGGSASGRGARTSKRRKKPTDDA